MNIYINPFDLSVRGVNSPSQGIKINIPEDIELNEIFKSIKEKRFVQKRNVDNNLLFKRQIGTELNEITNETMPIFEEIPFEFEHIIEYEKDENDNNLYLDNEGNETILSTSTKNYIIQKPYEPVFITKTKIELVEEFNIETNEIELIEKEIEYQEQKIDDNENLIYKYPVEDIWIETIENGFYDYNYEVILDNQLIILRDETFSYEPVMIEEEYDKLICLKENIYSFNINDIVNAKFNKIVLNAGFEYAYVDEFVTEEDLDLNNPNHSANTGAKILELLPNGQCKTKTIILDVPAKEFVLYLESDSGIKVELNEIPFVNDKVLLPIDTSEIVLTFKNETTNKANINAYALLY